MLPRYRLLVEKLAQQGLLPVICGTDTLGVGINVPIHTVVLTALTKFDGTKMRRLSAREFHQIAGRAGREWLRHRGHGDRAGHRVRHRERASALAQGGRRPEEGSARLIRRSTRPKGFVGWNKQTFERLIAAVPETLHPRLRITHSMVLTEVSAGRRRVDARIRTLIADSACRPTSRRLALYARADEIFDTLDGGGRRGARSR